MFYVGLFSGVQSTHSPMNMEQTVFRRCILSYTTRQILLNQILIDRRHVSAYTVAIFRPNANLRTNTDHCTWV
jgi:hypothetical protein